MPAHSDDEVTPRRGLDEQMSEDKLKQLDEDLNSTDGGALLRSPADPGRGWQATPNPAPRNDRPEKDDQALENTDLMSDLNEREDLEMSVVLQPENLTGRARQADGDCHATGKEPKAQNNNQKLMTTPRLFFGLDATGKGGDNGKKGAARKDAGEAAGTPGQRSEDGDSACNLIESTQSVHSLQEAFDGARGNQRYQLEDEAPFAGGNAGSTALVGQQESMIMGSQVEPGLQVLGGMVPPSSILQQKPKMNKRDLKSIENWEFDA